MSLVQSIAQVNQEIKEEEAGIRPEIKMRSIKFKDFFINRKILFATLAGTLFQFTQSCMEPVFASRLKEFGLSFVQIGLIYTITPLCFIIGSILSQPLKKFIDRRIIMIIGAFLCCVASLLIGPS